MCLKSTLMYIVKHAQVCKHNGWTRYLDELERLCCYALDALVARAPEDKNPRGHCSVVLDLTNMGTLSMDIQVCVFGGVSV